MIAIPCGVAAAAGWALDQVFGEPTARLHPVVWYGTTMRRLESLDHRDTRPAGVLHLAAGASLGIAAGNALGRLVGRPAATALAAYVSIAGRMLLTEATAVLAAVDDSRLDAARARLPTLVGRDVADLPETEIVRAVIESVAENTVDAVTAPLIWAAIGGAPAVLCHRAINTLDAMVGHRSPRYQRFGWASARADDVVNWLPARITALTVTLLRPAQTGAVLTTVRRDAARHPSPNGGVIEAAFAGALDVRLGGINRYRGHIDDRGALGDGAAPSVDDGRRAIRLARALGAVIATAIAVASVGAAAARHTTSCTRTGRRRRRRERHCR